MFCAEMGASLCSVEEVIDGCVAGDGCSFDDNFVWTASVGGEGKP